MVATPDVTSLGSRAVTVVSVGHPLFGIMATWDLFARGDGTMLRLEFARGRITRTVLPGLASSGPVFFVAASHVAIIHPLDFVPGYLVPDGQSPRALTGAVASGGVLLPGPRPDQFWISSGQGANSAMTLVGPDGRPITPGHAGRLTIPTTMNSFASPDGAGDLLLTGPAGVYDLRPSGMHRITTGTVLAVGPTRWLAAECANRRQCTLVMIDQATHARHPLGHFAGDPANASGVISPNGRTAALLMPENAVSGAPSLHFINLGTGGDRRIAGDFGNNAPAAPGASLAWSPDSRWLFTVNTEGQLQAVHALSGRTQNLDVPLPQVVQLAIR